MQDIHKKYSLDDPLFTVLDEIPVMVDVLDDQQNMLFWNKECERVTGYRKEEMYSCDDPFGLLYDREYAEKKLNEWDPNQDYKDWEWEFESKSGETKTISWSTFRIQIEGHSYASLCIGNDITERKLAMKKLIESEQKFRILMEQNLFGIVLVDDNNNWVYVNQKLADIMGYTIEEMQSWTVGEANEHVYPQDAKILRSKDTETFPNGLDFRVFNKSGNIRWLRQYSQFYQDRRVKMRLLTIIDVTDEKNIAKKLLDSELKYETLVNLSPNIIFTTDKYGKITFMNNSGLKIINSTLKETIGESFINYISDDDKGAGERAFIDAVADKAEIGLELTTMPPTGGGRVCYYHLMPIFDENDNFNTLIGVGRDITEEKMKKAEELKNRQIESISLLAGGIAHDFNNMLMGILGNVNLLQLENEDREETLDFLQNIESITLKAAKLTQQLLTFSKGGAPIKCPESIADIIKESVSFVMRGSKSKVYYEIDENLPYVHVDADQISQVFNNLILNSLQAMPTGGIIRIRVSQKSKAIDGCPLIDQNECIEIEVEDNGKGIPFELQDKVFDPYFTTKPEGNGLGLTTCLSIIQRHDGFITFKSKPDYGTTFTIYLPVTEREPEHHENSTSPVDKELAGKVLVVEDNEDLIVLLKSILDSLNLDPTIVKDGQNAMQELQLAEDSENSFDLIITDLTIPGGMGGKELVQNVRKSNSEIPIIVSSGYSNDPILAEYERYGFTDLLKKPYTLKEMKKTLSQYLKID